jgi:hypothetical protein
MPLVMAIPASDLCAVDCLRLGDGVHYLPCKEGLLCFDCRSCRYTPDAVDGIDNVVWLADSSLLDPISQVSATARSHTIASPLSPRASITRAQRVRSLMPVLGADCTSSGETFCGVNARWRLFKCGSPFKFCQICGVTDA